MNDLINRQMAIDAAMQDVSDKRSHDFNAGATRAANRIKQLPSAEKEEIIRCKDCKYLRLTGTIWRCQNRSVMMLCEMDDFCSRAERREE